MQKRIFEYSQYPIPYLDIDNYLFDFDLVSKFTREELIEFEFLPLDKFGNILTVCVCNPSLDLIKSLEQHTKMMVRIFWCEEKRLNNKINELKSNNKSYSEEQLINWKG